MNENDEEIAILSAVNSLKYTKDNESNIFKRAAIGKTMLQSHCS